MGRTSVAAVLILSYLIHPASAATKKRKRKTSHHTTTVKKPKTVRSFAFKPSQPAAFSTLAPGSLPDSSDEGVVENPAALVPFLYRLSRADDSAVHILHYGDSHTASDDWANSMRQILQSRFGNGGPGFIMAGHPFRGYRRFDVSGTSSSGWLTQGTVGSPGDGRGGLSGISISTNVAGQTVSLTVEAQDLKLLYLRQPGGGSLEVQVDGQPSGTLSTAGETGPGFFSFSSAPGVHHYELRTLESAPVRLLGWTADNRSGLTYETLGINGAQAPMLLDWDESILAAHIAQRDPALIVLAYGTNEALNPKWSVEGYAADLARVVDRFRKAAPAASILIVSPPDFGQRNRKGALYSGHLDEVIAVQRRIAMRSGCAFWDWRARMGGARSVVAWVQAGLGQPDHVHFTPAGYRTIGQMFLKDLMEQYRQSQAVKTE